MRNGFTMMETLLATSVLALVLAGAMGSWLLFMGKSNRANAQAELDMQARRVVERFRADMRNAARETIVFFPEGAMPYRAVGFALAADDDGDGLVDLDAGGSNILWRQTVVYHVYERSPTQMRRTIFTDRNNGATAADYYSQIRSVVESGSGGGACLPGESASTDVMFENLFTGKLWHAESTFDAYAPVANTAERVTFGSLPLDPGSHTVSFVLKGRNPESSGNRLVLDQLSASVSGWPLEAELREVSAGSAAPVYVGFGQAGAGYGLTAEIGAVGEQLDLEVANDAIEECQFVGEGRNVTISNTVTRFDATCRPTGFGQGVCVTALEGQYATAWLASEQSGSGSLGDAFIPTNGVLRIPLLPAYIRQDGFGPVFRLYKGMLNGGLRLENPVCWVYATPSAAAAPSPDVPAGEPLPLLCYQNGVLRASWAECSNFQYVDLRPAEGVRLGPGCTAMLSFRVRVSSFGADRFAAYEVGTPGVPGCWFIPGGEESLVREPTWSTDPRLKTIDRLPALVAMAVGYADGGDYVSHPYDTGLQVRAEKTLSWDADVPAGTALRLFARSGDVLSADGFTITDAPEWSSVGTASSGGVIAGGAGRYVQFRAVFVPERFSQFPSLSGGSSGTGPFVRKTPRLWRVLVSWSGQEKMVDVVATLLKGPDGGLFGVEVDGQPMIRGVTMEIEIFKDVVALGGVKRERLRSAMTAEVEPRNSLKR